jgi:hypothetical protein
MRCRSVACGNEVLNDNFSCIWTLCSTRSGDGWPQRSQLQPGVRSLGRCVTLLPATFCNLGLGDPLSSCNKRIVFISYSFLLGQTYGPQRSETPPRLPERSPIASPSCCPRHVVAAVLQLRDTVSCGYYREFLQLPPCR